MSPAIALRVCPQQAACRLSGTKIAKIKENSCNLHLKINRHGTFFFSIRCFCPAWAQPDACAASVRTLCGADAPPLRNTHGAGAERARSPLRTGTLPALGEAACRRTGNGDGKRLLYSLFRIFQHGSCGKHEQKENRALPLGGKPGFPRAICQSGMLVIPGSASCRCAR